jgi:hypothetical protein
MYSYRAPGVSTQLSFPRKGSARRVPFPSKSCSCNVTNLWSQIRDTWANVAIAVQGIVPAVAEPYRVSACPNRFLGGRVDCQACFSTKSRLLSMFFPRRADCQACFSTKSRLWSMIFHKESADVLGKSLVPHYLRTLVAPTSRRHASLTNKQWLHASGQWLCRRRYLLWPSLRPKCRRRAKAGRLPKQGRVHKQRCV